jgi:hypothetical protein
LTEQKSLQFPRLLALAYLLVAVGALLQIGSGHWDVTWHALEEPETFFTPPHSLVYLGVLLTLSMGILGIVLRLKHKYEKRYIRFLQYALIGSALQLFSGGFDLWWHTNFGFDGLLSPPHLVLVTGMVLNSLSGAAGLARITKMVRITPLLRIASIISFAALWMSSIGIIMLFTLPFSEGEHFDFNPDPLFGAAIATVAMPLISSIMIILSYRFLPVRFPVTVLTALYVFVNGMASVVAHYGIAPAMPYYVFVILAGVAADFVLRTKIGERLKTAVAGMLFAPFFYMLYFPLVPHAFREVMGIPVEVQITTINLFLATYQPVLAYTFVPAILLGLLGTILAQRISFKLQKEK